MDSLAEAENRLQEVKEEIAGLDEDLKQSRLTDLTELVARSGKLRGHLEGLTEKQYRKVTGKAPREGLMVKGKDATTKKVPWESVLDQMASELGFTGTRGDEQLKEAIEETKKDQQRIEKLRSDKRYLENVVNDIETIAVKSQTLKLTEASPLFPEEPAKAETTTIDGAEYTMIRQHSFWQLKEGDTPVGLVRYADDARSELKGAVRVHKEVLTLERQQKRLAKLKKKRASRRQSSGGTTMGGIRRR